MSRSYTPVQELLPSVLVMKGKWFMQDSMLPRRVDASLNQKDELFVLSEQLPTLFIEGLEAEHSPHDQFAVLDRYIQRPERIGFRLVGFCFTREKVSFILGNGAEGEGFDTLTQFLNHGRHTVLFDQNPVYCRAPVL